ncbi:MAG: hypothetical protein IKE95_04240 [Methanobrevibacter sp.]|nr:hypothetical protein [Methanobrevibacter sp.]
MKEDENTTLKVYDSSIVLDEKFKNEKSRQDIRADRMQITVRNADLN